MIRIAFINELYGTARQGGEQESLAALGHELAKTGMNVSTWSYTGTGGSTRIETRIPLRFLLIPFFRDLFVLPCIGKKIVPRAEAEADVLITSSLFLLSKITPKKPVIFSCHAIRSQKSELLAHRSFVNRILFNPLIRYRLRALEIRACKRAWHIVVLHDRMQSYLIDRLHVPAEKISIIPNAVDTTAFAPSDKQKKHVLFVGRATYLKGIDMLIAAAPHIKAPLVVITKIVRPRVRAEAERAGIRFVFRVPHSKIPAFLAEAYCFVLPSRDEEMPLTVLESLAAGVPVVTTPVGSGGVAHDGHEGFVLNELTPQTLAGACNRLITDAPLAKTFSIAARQKAERDLTWDATRERYAAIIRNTAAGL